MAEAWAERTTTRVLNAVPGYAGYRAKESRRDADRAVRDKLATSFDRQADRAERVGAALADARRIHDVGPVNDFAAQIRHLIDRIRTATYGYGGLFGSRDVDAAVLDQMRLFDESLFAGVDQLDGPIAALEAAAGGEGDVPAAAAAGATAVRDILDRLDGRAQIAESAVPAAPEQLNRALAVLQTPEEQAAAHQPPPAYDLHDRDALAILGENFLVDARIGVESAAAFFRLFRVDLTPERWLLVPRQRERPLALLTAATDPFVTGATPAIGAETYIVDASGHGSGDVVGVGGKTERTALSFFLLHGATDPSKRAAVLQWGTEQQVLVGIEVHPDDIEIFGKPT